MKYFVLGLQLLPAILGAVKAVEANVALPKAGADKLALVTGVVEDAYASLADAGKEDFSRESVTRLVAGIITRVVAMFNRLGVFQGS